MLAAVSWKVSPNTRIDVQSLLLIDREMYYSALSCRGKGIVILVYFVYQANGTLKLQRPFRPSLSRCLQY